jgi:uncharacterized protein YbjT (DUF2867 family)
MPRPLTFVAGATGYTGRAVVAALRRRGVPVIAHVRPDAVAAEEWRARFEALGAEVDLTAWEDDAMRALLAHRQPGLVFALLGTTRARAAREGISDAYERIDYGLTAMLLRAAWHAGNLPRFVYLSSLGAREDTRSPYLAVRGRLERELRASPLPYLIVRPSFISGGDRGERRPAERVAAIAVDAVLTAAGWLGARTMRDRFSSLTGEELAEGMVALALPERDGRAEADAATIRAALRRLPRP